MAISSFFRGCVACYRRSPLYRFCPLEGARAVPDNPPFSGLTERPMHLATISLRLTLGSVQRDPYLPKCRWMASPYLWRQAGARLDIY